MEHKYLASRTVLKLAEDEKWFYDGLACRLEISGGKERTAQNRPTPAKNHAEPKTPTTPRAF